MSCLIFLNEAKLMLINSIAIDYKGMLTKKENKIITSKYTKLSFFPLNLYTQFTKYQNLFFLLTLILLTIPTISPFTPFTYLIAFVLVLGASMTKDAIEDYRRHQQDKMLNKKIAHILKLTPDSDKIIVNCVYIEDIKSGDFVMVKEGDEIPGDMILLGSKTTSNNGLMTCVDCCYVETSSIDGESNLKRKILNIFDRKEYCEVIDSIYYTNQLIEQSNVDYMPIFCTCDLKVMQSIKEFKIKDTGMGISDLECDLISCNNDKIKEKDKNILLRGSRLKNTQQILGIIISVGKNTKLSKSIKPSKPKNSIFEKMLSSKLYTVFILYFILLTITSILGTLFLKKDNIEYLYLDKNKAAESLQQTGTNYILFSYLVPISLFVTIEVARIFYLLYISHDPHLTIDGISSNCKNSNSIEDIGIIQYILTDKTGTLTKNKMHLKHYHLRKNKDMLKSGKIFESFNVDKRDLLSQSLTSSIFLQNFIDSDYKDTEGMTMFILALLCCNDVEPINDKLEGISQDEVCILKALKNEGFILKERINSDLIIKLRSIKLNIKIEMLYDFTSRRQRMSTVVNIGEKYFLFTKGSDQKLLGDKNKMYDFEANEEYYQMVKNIIDKNSEYRTLVVAYKEIQKEDFLAFKERYDKILFESKDFQMDELFEEVERGLIYVGTTFIEDKLQNNMNETITSLFKAGIRIWMITGDKKETARSCAINSSMMNRNKEVDTYITSATSFLEEIKTDKAILKYKSAVIYRATPDQKATIAEFLIKSNKNTLAIGDGNNDVPMLQTANVGVGIRGKEGTQASITADFSIPEFQCLKRLLLIHGRYNFIRFAKLAVNSIGKNFLLIMVQFYYNFYNGYSGTPVFNSFFLSYFNVLFTSFVPLTMVLFDKDTSEEELMRNPEKYKETNNFFSNKMLFANLMLAILLSAIIFWVSLGIINERGFSKKNGLVCGYSEMNNYYSLLVFLTVLLRQIRSIDYYVFFTYIAVFISVVLYFATIFGIQELFYTLTGAALNLYTSPVFYFSVLLIMGIVFVLALLYEIIERKIELEH